MASVARVKKLFKVMRIDQQSEIIIKNTDSVFMDRLSAEYLESDINSAEFQEVIIEVISTFKKRVFGLSSQIYTELFTDDEIDELISIYSSPVFQKILSLSPEINKRTMVFIADHMSELEEQVDTRIKAIFESHRTKLTH